MLADVVTINVVSPTPSSVGMVKVPEAPDGNPLTLRFIEVPKAPTAAPMIPKENVEPCVAPGGVRYVVRLKSGVTKVNWEAVKFWV